MFNLPSLLAWLAYWAAITPLSKIWGQKALNWYLSTCKYICTAEYGWDYPKAAFWFSAVVFAFLAMPAIAHFLVEWRHHRLAQSDK